MLFFAYIWIFKDIRKCLRWFKKGLSYLNNHLGL